MLKELTIRITGEAGQGMQTVGMALCKIFKDAGLHVFANLDYMSRIRGGNNFFQIRVSEKPVYTLREKADVLVCLDAESLAIHESSLSENGIIVLDEEKFNIKRNEKPFFNVPLYKIAEEAGGSELFINSAASGLIAGLINVEFGRVEETLRDVFADKEENIIDNNIKAAKKGYEIAEKSEKRQAFSVKGKKPISKEVLINGNESIALGAIHAGCKFYSAYPMTPSTSIMNTIVHYSDKFGILVEQAEDEIAAINMIIGASFAGVRAMASTSGGGFALMQEGVSLAAMTETPIVVAEVQRPGPATGFPTRTEQGDLDFVLHAGHGEFAKIIFSPGSAEECFYLTVKAFNMADKYQIPVFILSDQHLADSIRNTPKFDLEKVRPERHIITKEESKDIKEYKRYAITESGVSPRAVPSWINDVIYADSDEHTEEGHITEEASARNKMTEKRFYKKMKSLKNEVEKPTYFGNGEAETVFIGFGSTLGVMKEAAEALKDKEAGFIHLSQVWPLPEEELKNALKGKKNILTIENNAGGQLARLIEREIAVRISGSILKFDGRPFSVDEIVQRVSKEI